MIARPSVNCVAHPAQTTRSAYSPTGRPVSNCVGSAAPRARGQSTHRRAVPDPATSRRSCVSTCVALAVGIETRETRERLALWAVTPVVLAVVICCAIRIFFRSGSRRLHCFCHLTEARAVSQAPSRFPCPTLPDRACIAARLERSTACSTLAVLGNPVEIRTSETTLRGSDRDRWLSLRCHSFLRDRPRFVIPDRRGTVQSGCLRPRRNRRRPQPGALPRRFRRLPARRSRPVPGCA